MKVSTLFRSIAIIFGFMFNIVSATVVKEDKTYPCLKNGSELFTESVAPNCDQRWTKGDMSIGNYNDKYKECVSPCKEVFSGKITLSECPNVTLTIVCHSGENGDLQERRINYYAVEEKLGNEHRHLILVTSATVPTDPNIHYGLFGVLVLLITGSCGILVCWCLQRRREAQAPHAV